MAEMAERSRSIIDKIKELEGMEFSGCYQGTQNIEYEKGATTRLVVEVDDNDAIIPIINEIIKSDFFDEVWKGMIIGFRDEICRLWVEDIDWNGKDEDFGYTSFQIVGIEPVYGLNWKRKQYDAVINIKLKAV